MLDIKKLREEFDKISATISEQDTKDWLIKSEERAAAEIAALENEELFSRAYLPKTTTFSNKDYTNIITQQEVGNLKQTELTANEDFILKKCPSTNYIETDKQIRQNQAA